MAETVNAPTTWGETERIWLRSSVISRQADVAQRRRNWEQTQTLLSQLVQLKPDRPDLRSRWAAALYRAGRSRQAFEQLDMAHQQEQRYPRPEVAMATMCAKGGDFDGADQWYEKAVAADPENPLVHWAWGMSLLLQNRADEAEAQATAAAKLGLDSAALKLQRGIIARLQDKPDDAEMFLTRATEQAANQPEITFHLVAALLAQKDPAKSKRALELAQAASPEGRGSTLALAALAMARNADGQTAEALQAARAAVQQPNAHPEAVFLLGQLLAGDGQQEEARQVALGLQAMLAEPTIFVARDAAHEWVKATLTPNDAVAN